jgi:hypothetical protein
MSKVSRSAGGRRWGSRPLPTVVVVAALAVGLFAGQRGAAADPPRAASSSASGDDWTLHTALGLDLGVGSTISSYSATAGPSGTLFYTALRGTYDLPRHFQALLTLRQWWLPDSNHATMLGIGARYEPFVYSWGRVFFNAALGPTSTSYAWAFGYDLGGGVELDLPDAPGFSLGPYLLYGSVINPDSRSSDDGHAWNLGASFTYHFGRAAAAVPSPEVEHHRHAGGSYRISIPDTDHDGVADDEDQCRDTPAGRNPDPFRPGCPEADEDGDGVPDVDDACPVTPPGDKPDPKRPGCPFIDSDNDGISDADDACPSRPGPASPDAAKNGCPDSKKRPAAAPPPPSATDEGQAPKPVRKRHLIRPPEGQ